MEFFNCRSLSDAECLLKESVSDIVTGTESVFLPQALGRITAADIISQEDIPPFNRSTVDGYAVHSGDTFGAGEGIPVILDIVGEVLMGQVAPVKLSRGQAVAIPTGAMLPEGADAVVMLEHSDRPDGETILILRAVAPGENVIITGEDLKKGEIIIKQGEKITASHIGALVACGCAEVAVRRQLVVGIISTGDEIVDVDANPVAGQIRDINSYALAAMVEESGYKAIRYGIVRDCYDELLTMVEKATSQCSLVLISGGSSVGARDHTVKALEALAGRPVLLHGVAVKPGKPTIFSMIGKTPVFGLPGHPVSAMVICHQLVKPVAALLAGQKDRARYTLTAKLTRNVASAPGRDDIIRVRISRIAGEYLAEPVFGKSGLVSALAKADGLVRIDDKTGGLYAGDRVEVSLIRPLE